MMEITEDTLLLPGERLDDLQLSGMYIIQNKKRFCFGVDAVFLTDFVRVKEGDTVLDMGTGTGVIPLLLSAKTKASHLTGLEIQKESAHMAKRSVRYNGLQDRIDIVEGDIKEASHLFRGRYFDVITVNPPYMAGSTGLQNKKDAMTIARHEVLCTVDDILRESMRLLQDKGRIFMVHRPHRLAELLIKFHQYHMEAKRIQLIHPYADKEPTMVMIEGVRGAKTGLKIEPPIVMYERCMEGRPGEGEI